MGRKARRPAVARGAFGAPTFFVGDEMFSATIVSTSWSAPRSSAVSLDETAGEGEIR
jgi:hypothetical protein